MKKRISQNWITLAAVALATAMPAVAQTSPRIYELWELEPAPNNGRSQWEATKSSKRPRSYDRDWERWSYPVGNGYTGVSILARNGGDCALSYPGVENATITDSKGNAVETRAGKDQSHFTSKAGETYSLALK